MTAGQPSESLILTARDTRLLEAGAMIASAEPDSDDVFYMHSIMCQVGLPRSRRQDLVFERTCGTASMRITAGSLWNGLRWLQQPIPYGTMPRLILAYMNTFAVQNKTPEVPIGRSKTDFMRLLGKRATGGRTGTIAMFDKQLLAIAACSIALGFCSQPGMPSTFDGKPVKQFDAWVKQDGSQLSLWPAKIVFTSDYYATLRDHAVPYNIHAVMALADSALAMDVYFMLAQRLHRIERRPVFLRWANLYEQFGKEYTGKNARGDFQTKYLKALRDALTVYPKARVEKVRGGLQLFSSPPPIPYAPKCC